jgi:hypothetical protein
MSLAIARWADDQKRVMVIELFHGWDWEDWEMAEAKTLEMRASVPYVVDMIIDVTLGGELPTLRTIPNIRRSWERLPRDESLLIIVGAPDFLRRLAQMMAQLYGASHRFHTVGSLDEALQVIAHKWNSPTNSIDENNS